MKTGVFPRASNSATALARTGIGGTGADAVLMPYNTVEDDIMIMVLVHKAADWATLPGDWTLIARDIIGSTRGEIYWKRAAADEAGPYEVSGLSVSYYAIASYSGCASTGNPIDAYAIRANTGPASGTVGVATTVDNCTIICAEAASSNSYSFSGWLVANIANGCKEIADAGSATGGTRRVGMAHTVMVSAGDTGATSMTGSVADNVGMCIALKPDPAQTDLTYDVLLTGAPTNTTQVAAYSVVALPTTIVETVEEGSFPTEQTYWFKYVPSAGEQAFGFFAWTNPCFAPKFIIAVDAYYSESLTQVYSGTYYYNSYGLTRPFTVPVIQGETYYIKIKNAAAATPPADRTGAAFRIRFFAAPAEGVANGDILINDDSANFPIAVLDPADGSTKQFYNPFPAGETGAILDNGYSLFSSAYDTAPFSTDDLYLYDPNLTLVAEVSGAAAVSEAGAPLPQIAGGHTSKFYVGDAEYNGGAWGPYVIKTVDIAGNVGATTWSIVDPGGFYYLGVSADETIAYYYTSAATVVKRWDLVNDIALTNLCTLPTNYTTTGPGEILCLSDGSIIIYGKTFVPSLTYVIFHYGADGTLLNTYSLIDSDNANRLAYDSDTTDTYFWAWTVVASAAGMKSRFAKIRVSDGAVMTSYIRYEFSEGRGMAVEGNSTTPQDFGYSPSCPFLIARAGTVDAAGFSRTLLYAFHLMEGRGGWFSDQYTPSVVVHYGDEGSGAHRVLCGTDGSIFALTGTDDNGTAIACHIRTGSRDQGDSRYHKLYGDIMLDAETASQDVLATPGFNNFAVTGSVATINNAVRTQTPFDVSGEWITARNIALDLAWDSTTPAYIYSWEPRWTEEGGKLLAYSWETCHIAHEQEGFLYLGDLYLVHISTADLTLTITIDEVAQTPITIANSAGLHKKSYIRLPVMKGKLFKYRLTSTAQFRIEGADSELRLKPWGKGGSWQVQRLFQENVTGGEAA